MSPKESDVQKPGPANPVRCPKPKPRHNREAKERWIPKILFKSSTKFPVRDEIKSSKSQ
jgi:hypothetical protein